MYYVYMLANNERTAIATGKTTDLTNALNEHKTQPGFTKQYKCFNLVYFEYTQFLDAAIAREQAIASWPREQKEKLISSTNPNWDDLSTKLHIG